MRQFSERNPAVLAVVGTVVLVLLFLGTFFSESLPVIGRGTTYTAYFAESAGLTTKSEVRIAGVKVGKVTEIRLEGAQVAVEFTVQDAWVGEESTAAIKLKTLLGQKYLQVDPVGEEALDPGRPIPLERTTVPFDIAAATETLVTTQESIDVEQLADSFRALSSAFSDTPEDVQTMLEGLSALARTIASRDDELARLMRSLEQVTGAVSGVDKEVERLLQDGRLLLGELDRRRTALTQLLRGTRALAGQLRGLVEDNEARLVPALRKLDKVSALLVSNKANIESALTLLGPYYLRLSDTAGAGNWVDGYLCGLFDDEGRPVLDAEARRSCDPQEWR